MTTATITESENVKPAYSIRNLKVNATENIYSSDKSGLFGFINGGEVRYVRIIDANIYNWSNAGILAGKSFNGIFFNCHVEGTVESPVSAGNAGLLIGENRGGIVSSCSSRGMLKINGAMVGGLIGYNDGGNILSCEADVTVAGYEYLGGLVGKNENASVQKCVARGSVSTVYSHPDSAVMIGGLIGCNYNSSMLESFAVFLSHRE